jgi:hypothetical protein
LAAAEAAKPAIVLRKVESAEPTAAMPEPARAEFDENTVLARLSELGKAGDFQGALSLIREVRSAKPAWLSSRAVELERLEVGYYGRTGDRLGLRSAARRYITGDRLRSAQMIEIARELKSAGQTDDAIFLLKELLAKVPDYGVAKKLITEWSPAPEKAVP